MAVLELDGGDRRSAAAAAASNGGGADGSSSRSSSTGGSTTTPTKKTDSGKPTSPSQSHGGGGGGGGGSGGDESLLRSGAGVVNAQLPSAAERGALLGVVHVGLAGRVMGELAPTESLRFTLRMRALAYGLQRLASVTLLDQLSGERHQFVELGYVNVQRV